MHQQWFLRKLPSLVLIFNIFAVNVKFIHTQYNVEPLKRCPEGYLLYTNGLCYPVENKPCPFDNVNETLQTPPTPSTTTMQVPIELKKLRCPHGSIMIEDKCRKIICSLGEYYRGTCLQTVCPPGLVWRAKKCQKPGYLTTIIEIDNLFVNQLDEKPIALSTSQKNEVVYHTSTTTTTVKPQTTRSLPLISTTIIPRSTTTKNNPTNCCEVITPRICKLYGEKWLCFNRKHRRCDSRICSSSVIQLKPPEIKFEHPSLIMPPNPQLPSCKTNTCHNNFYGADCSGCFTLRTENCSLYCYRYMCPKNTCTFMDLEEYCRYYQGQDGCLPNDGCLWNWCEM